MGDKFRVYIAGAIAGSGLQLQNVRTALFWGDQVWADGMIPFVPHLYSFWDMLTPRLGDQWLDLDFSWLETCHALLRIPGESPGSDREWHHAICKGIQCFKTEEYQELLNYFRNWNLRQKISVKFSTDLEPVRPCSTELQPVGGSMYQDPDVTYGGVHPEKMKGYCDQFGGSDYLDPMPIQPRDVTVRRHGRPSTRETTLAPVTYPRDQFPFGPQDEDIPPHTD